MPEGLEFFQRLEKGEELIKEEEYAKMEAPAIIRNARGHRHSEGLKRRRMGVL